MLVDSYVKFQVIVLLDTPESDEEAQTSLSGKF